MYVPRMTKNMIFFETLKDKVYIVTFEDGKVSFWSKYSRKGKVIKVRKGNLLRLQFELAQDLVSCS